MQEEIRSPIGSFLLYRIPEKELRKQIRKLFFREFHQLETHAEKRSDRGSGLGLMT